MAGQYLWIIFVCLNPLNLVFGWGVETLRTQEPRNQEPTCTYTFNVPREGSVCSPGSQESVDSLETLITNQHALLEQHLNVITEKLVQLEQKDENNEEHASVPCIGVVGTTYVRWGRTSCPETAKDIYQGYVGKSHYSHAGGGVNYLCLPDTPEHPDGASSVDQSGSRIYGTEYEHGSSPVLDPSHQNNDVPCVVCDVEGRSRALMIPAKMTCPDGGWVKEYQGLLMSDHYTHKGSEFICVSDGMEDLPGGAANDNGGLLYVVETKCGSLKCPPYVDGYEVACVVCTK